MRQIIEEIFKKVDKAIIMIIKKSIKNNHLRVKEIKTKLNAKVRFDVNQQ
jgi:hypothetical protein